MSVMGQEERSIVFGTGLLYQAAPPPAIASRAILRGMKQSGDYFDVVVFASDGAPFDWPPQHLIMVLDRDHMPAFEHRPMIVDSGYGCVRLPCADQPFAIGMPLPVAGFGHVHVYADNEGRGYESREVARRRLNLNLEFAKSRIAGVRRAEKAWTADLPSPTREYRGAMSQAETLLADALKKDSEPVLQARLAMSSLARSLRAGEMLSLERARARIAAGAKRPDMLYGCNGFAYAKHGARYAELFRGLYNYVTAPFYRNHTTEKVEGTRDYSAAEGIAAWANRAGIQVKGHPLIWLHEAGTPDWQRGRSYESILASHLDYVADAVGRFTGRIDRWDIINEAHSWNNIHRWPYEKLIEITKKAAETARQANPRAQRIVNCCFTWSEYAATGWGWNNTLDDRARSTLEYCRDLLAADASFEAIGLQMYDPGRDLFEIDRHLEAFIGLGKTVHITEMGISSKDTPIVTPTQIYVPNRMRWHDRPWSENEQADWIEGFYTICVAKPQVEALTWWDFADPSFLPYGGMVDGKLRPKKGYHRLRKLIASWR
jgi:GH35 family endo-1,4-beta-xylanase